MKKRGWILRGKPINVPLADDIRGGGGGMSHSQPMQLSGGEELSGKLDERLSTC